MRIVICWSIHPSDDRFAILSTFTEPPSSDLSIGEGMSSCSWFVLTSTMSVNEDDGGDAFKVFIWRHWLLVRIININANIMIAMKRHLPRRFRCCWNPMELHRAPARQPYKSKCSSNWLDLNLHDCILLIVVLVRFQFYSHIFCKSFFFETFSQYHAVIYGCDRCIFKVFLNRIRGFFTYNSYV